MRVNLTHNDNIKTFDDVARHVELEEDRLQAGKLINEAFISETKMRGAYGSKYTKGKAKGPKYANRGIEASSNGHKRKREKCYDKKDKNINCFNCGKPGHCTHNYTEPKTQEQPTT
jgi:hypothetical protein